MKFDNQNPYYKHLTTVAQPEETKRASVTFLPTSTLQEKSIRLCGVSFTDLDDATQKLYIKVLLKNEPAAQHNMLKKQFEFDIKNLALIAQAIDAKRQQKDVNLNTNAEDQAMGVLTQLIMNNTNLKALRLGR